MVTEQHAAGALDGSVDPEELTTLIAQENQGLIATISQLKAENAELRRDAERYRLRYETLREMLPPQFSSIVEASSGTADRMASMDTMIDALAADQAMTKEQQP